MNISAQWKAANTIDDQMAVIEKAYELDMSEDSDGTDGFGQICGEDKAEPFNRDYAEFLQESYVLTLSDGSILAAGGGDTTEGHHWWIIDDEDERYQCWKSNQDDD